MTAHYTRTTRRGRRSRFTAAHVEAMQREKDAGMTLKWLAAKYCTPVQHIKRLLKGENGPRLGVPVKPAPIPRTARDPAADNDVKGLKARGFSLLQIAAITGLPYREVDARLGPLKRRMTAAELGQAMGVV